MSRQGQLAHCRGAKRGPLREQPRQRRRVERARYRRVREFARARLRHMALAARLANVIGPADQLCRGVEPAFDGMTTAPCDTM